MANQIIVVGLIFFFTAAVATASDATSAPSGAAALAANPSLAEGPTDNIIGSISGGATDAAPVGGPVPEGVFTNLTPGPGHDGGAAALEGTAVARAVAAAGVVGSLFFF